MGGHALDIPQSPDYGDVFYQLTSTNGWMGNRNRTSQENTTGMGAVLEQERWAREVIGATAREHAAPLHGTVSDPCGFFGFDLWIEKEEEICGNILEFKFKRAV